MTNPITIIGGGLAGSEAALQLARMGLAVELWEQRLAPAPEGGWTPAHVSAGLAELVCSNSFKSTDPLRAPGLLKEELRRLGCRLLPLADSTSVPGGAALCVDRELFSSAVTEAVRAEPLITLIGAPFAQLTEYAAAGRIVIVASGPLSSDALWAQLAALIGGGERLYFYDATSPVLDADSVDKERTFALSRYGKGDGEDYINCPFDARQYAEFRGALTGGEVYPLHSGDDYKLFEGCLPIEELAARGEDTMRFGPLKPRGLADPRTGREPHAAVQLRREDAFHHALGLVGFQTRLKYGEQERIFRLIPGLENARFMRYGRMHRNCYVEAPKVLLPTLQLAAAPNVLLAGQITGLEGYLAGVATGLWAARTAAALHWSGDVHSVGSGDGSSPLQRRPAAAATQNYRDVTVPASAPEGSCIGGMLRFMTNPAHKKYAPTGFQFGMHTWLPQRMRDRDKQALIRRRAEEAWEEMATTAFWSVER